MRYFCPYCPRSFPTEAKRAAHIGEKQMAGNTAHLEVALTPKGRPVARVP